MKSLISKSIAEALGTFAIVFFGCGAVVVSAQMNATALGHSVPVVFGLTVAFMIYATGHISGAHFNPAVSLAFAAIKMFSWKVAPIYVLAQISGGLLGAFLLRLLFPEALSLGETLPQISMGRVLLTEAVLSFFLMFVITAVATDNRAVGTMAGAAIGATVAVCAFVGGPLTGASMNPARSLGPALFSGHLDGLWLYFVGPIAGAILGAMTYRFIRCAKPGEATDSAGCC